MGGLIAGGVIGAIIGWIAATVWRNTPTGQTPPIVFLTHRETGESYRLERYYNTVSGFGGRVVILYRVSNYALEAWPEERVDAEFDRDQEPPSPSVQKLLDEARKRAAARG